MLGDKYVEVSSYSSEANETYNNFEGEMPPFLFRPEGEPPSRQKPQNGADKPPVIGENDYTEGYQITSGGEKTKAAMWNIFWKTAQISSLCC